MVRTNRFRRLAFFLSLFLFVAAIGVGMTLRTVRQARLNHALAEAIKENSPHQVKALLAQGANPNTPIPDELPWEKIALAAQPSFQPSLWQRLLCALQGRQWEPAPETIPPVYAALALPNRGSCLGTFIREPEAEIVKALLEAGADPNTATKEGATAVMIAASAHELSESRTLRLLIVHGADVNAKTRDGWSAKRAAASSMLGASRNIEILQQAGAK
jgi:ankyrin repeat protein